MKCSLERLTNLFSFSFLNHSACSCRNTFKWC